MKRARGSKIVDGKRVNVYEEVGPTDRRNWFDVRRDIRANKREVCLRSNRMATTEGLAPNGKRR